MIDSLFRQMREAKHKLMMANTHLQSEIDRIEQEYPDRDWRDDWDYEDNGPADERHQMAKEDCDLAEAEFNLAQLKVNVYIRRNPREPTMRRITRRLLVAAQPFMEKDSKHIQEDVLLFGPEKDPWRFAIHRRQIGQEVFPIVFLNAIRHSTIVRLWILSRILRRRCFANHTKS